MKKASSRPTITIYPGDELRSPIWFCSLATHGLWIRLRLVAHDTERPGILSHLGEPITHELLARKCGTTLEAMIPHLEEITKAGLMVKDTKGFYVIPDVINHEKKKAEWRKNKAKKECFTVGVESQENLKRISIESTPLSSSLSFSPSPSNSTSQTKDSKEESHVENPQIRPKFSPPTPQEVTEYASSIGFTLDGHKFCDYYESKGWVVGKARMKDWRAGVRTWKGNGVYYKGGFNGNGKILGDASYTPGKYSHLSA